MRQAVKIFPWKGPNYDSRSMLRYKVLLLGESNYTNRAPNSNLVEECVTWHLTKNDDLNFARFATKVLRVSFPEGSVIKASEFWNGIAFYNFIQCLVGYKARQRPTKRMWDESAEPFKEVVQKLKPERIFVLGKANWENLRRTFEHEKVDQYKAWLCVGGKIVLAGYTNHPSSRGFSYAVWRPVVEGLLGFSGRQVKDTFSGT